MRTVSFQTRARTIDHLGREQIADVPTAISELWKNAYDAYAKSVALTLFDEDPLVATIADDGHGMSYEELIDRWLVIGTESKLLDDTRSDEDRAGLAPRTRQGQKGIGRLSSAHLGPLILLLSQRRGHLPVAALVDWRLFENPFLLLTDIEVPVLELSCVSDIFEKLPSMAETLAQNILGSNERAHSSRIREAWERYDLTNSLDRREDGGSPLSIQIVESCRAFRLQERHFGNWPLWRGTADRGTIMVISAANDEFGALLPQSQDLASAREDRRRFRTTLGGFVDPLFDPARPVCSSATTDFEYGVYLHGESGPEKLIGSDREFNRELTNEMEHIVDGRIDDFGVFRGQIKSFGKWRRTGQSYEVRPPRDFALPTGRNTRLGPIDVYLATFEQTPSNSSHTPQEWERLKTLASGHAGLMLYRNGLRVMPYGREDNDFFEIEKRRSINAGREYWNARRMFGRIAITREENPNLKDKAGREGFIINKAAKTLKTLIVNVLRATAYDYFGSNSPDRAPELEVANRNFAERAAREAQAALRSKNRKQFRKRLKEHSSLLPAVVEQVKAEIAQTRLEVPDDIAQAQEKLEAAQARLSDLRLPGAPSSLGTLEDDYRAYRRSMTEVGQLLNSFATTISEAVERIQPPAPEELLSKQIHRNESLLSSRVTRWARAIKALQESEQARVSALVSERNKILRQETRHLIDGVTDNRLTLTNAMTTVNETKARIDSENELLFQNYILALENLRDSIDIQAVAVLTGEENAELRSQVDRLNGLAQLGITVEFLDHELHAHDTAIIEGLRQLRSKFAGDGTLERVTSSYSGLKQMLDFLGPLRMSGKPQARWITGGEIHVYVARFFDRLLSAYGVRLITTVAFQGFSLFEKVPRVLPTFLNLVSNSLYWLINGRVDNPTIVLDISDEKVVISDNGPGVDEIDVKRLFTLFFTRKAAGGRGVGLYLCKANLSAGGHSIRYVTEPERKRLPGANFEISFRGATFGK